MVAPEGAMSHATLTTSELLGLFGHFLVLSLFSVGGAISAAPDMHRTLVLEHRWLDDTTFTTSIALAQAAPGPNVLFVAVLGWNAAGPMGALATMVGILLPSTILTLGVTRWGHARRETRGVRAFTSGLTPITIGLLFSTGWVLALPYVREPGQGWGALALIVVTLVVMTRTRWSPMWLVALGAIVGGLGWA
jgi:chromate transporter